MDWSRRVVRRFGGLDRLQCWRSLSSKHTDSGEGVKKKEKERLPRERGLESSEEGTKTIDRRSSVWEVFQRVFGEETSTSVQKPRRSKASKSSPSPNIDPESTLSSFSVRSGVLVEEGQSVQNAIMPKQSTMTDVQASGLNQSRGQRVSFLNDNTLYLQELGITLIGVSASGIGTTIYVKELSVCFDAGRYHHGVEGARVYAISHGHSDHIGALHHILRVRGQTRASAPKPTILMPECYLKNWMKLFKYSMLMDAGPDGSVLDYKALCNVQAVSNDEVARYKVDLPRGLELMSFPVDHRVPACAYVIVGSERTLLAKYRKLSSQQISALAGQGEQVSDLQEVYKLAFTGDTTIDGVLRHPQLLKAKVLIMECTFMCERTQKRAAETKHIHLADIARHADKFENDLIVLIHISERYSPRDAMAKVNQLQRDCPNLRGKLVVWRGR